MVANILSAQIGHAIGLQRLGTGILKRVLKLLGRTDADIESQIRHRLAGLATGSVDSDPTIRRLHDLREAIGQANAAAYDRVQARLLKDGLALAEYEATFQAGLLGVVTNDEAIRAPTAETLSAIVMKRPFQGRVLREWVGGLQEGRATRIMDAVRIGMVEGETVDQIVRRVRGTRAMGYRDGVLEISRRDAEAVVRTAVTHIASGASEAFYAANPSTIRAVRWTSVLDSRTTPICGSRDGKVYDVGKGPRPPAHWRCRSFMSPVLHGEADEGERVTYGVWLKRQPATVQDDVLGVAKGKLFREGGLTIDRFVDRAGREYTLDELRHREADAFRKASLAA